MCSIILPARTYEVHEHVGRPLRFSNPYYILCKPPLLFQAASYASPTFPGPWGHQTVLALNCNSDRKSNVSQIGFKEGGLFMIMCHANSRIFATRAKNQQDFLSWLARCRRCKSGCSRLSIGRLDSLSVLIDNIKSYLIFRLQSSCSFIYEMFRVIRT